MTTAQQFALRIAETARNIAASSYEEVLNSLRGEMVFIMKYNAKAELNVMLDIKVPGIFKAGRYTFVPDVVTNIKQSADGSWVIHIL
jgi:hypothetical protein